MRPLAIRSGVLMAAVALFGSMGGSVVDAQTPPYTFTLLAGGESLRHRDAMGSQARLYRPHSVATDAAGVVYVSDSGSHVIRRIAVNRTVTTLAGSPEVAGSADGVGTAARFSSPAGLAVDSTGGLVVADSANFTIRRVTPGGTVTTWAGSAGSAGHVDGDRTVARFGALEGVAIDPSGNVWVVDRGNSAVRLITPAGVVSTVATDLGDVRGIAIDATGRAHITANNTILRVTSSGVVTTLAGGPQSGSVDGPGASALLRAPVALACDAAGQLYVVESGAGFGLRKIAPDGAVTTVATLVDADATLIDLLSVAGVLVRPSGELVLADSRGIVSSLTPGGRYAVLAGSLGWGSDDGARTAAQFFHPAQVAVDRRGNVFVADTFNYTIRRIGADGQVTTVAGRARVHGSAGGPAASARFRNPSGVAVGPDDSIVIGDTYNGSVRVLANGEVTTRAGTVGVFGPADGVGPAAQFGFTPTPFGQQLAVDAAGVIYFADASAHTLRRITAAGEVTTLAGLAGQAGSVDGTGAAARFTQPRGVAVDATGNVYVSDDTSIRRVTSSGVVTTITSSLGGAALAFDRDGTLLVADGARLRRVTMTGVVTLVGEPDSGRIGGVAVGPGGEVYVSSTNNGGPDANRIWVGLRSDIAPSQVTAPVDASVGVGGIGHLSVMVTGSPTPALQWERLNSDGTTWSALPEATPYAGTFTSSLSISPATSAMHGSRYRVVATNLAGTATSDSAALAVNAMSASPIALRFAAHRLTTNSTWTLTPEQQVTVLTSGSGGITWTASTNKPWVRITGGSGTGAGQFVVQVIESQMRDLVGTQTAVVTISAPASDVTTVVPVTLEIDPVPGFGAAPFGVVDTPVQDQAGVVGAVSMTGWALDDLGVRLVRIYRSCAPFESGRAYCVTLSGLPHLGPVVELGDATFVTGARPDVEALYPDYPAANRAGWGFMILSNMLPNVPAGLDVGGVGPITLHALAFTEPFAPVTPLGRAVLDQTPTRLTLANDTIAKPFGAIDTPTQGATVSGTVNNFGWVLTPDPGTGVLMPTNGSTITVFVDGAPVGTSTYNLCRGTVGSTPAPGVLCDDDVSTAFRGDGTRFRNLDAGRGPIGLRSIDTTTLANGLHTLSWGVADSASRGEGIGSRYFNVVNGTPRHARGDLSPSKVTPDANSPDVATYARTGFDVISAYTPLVRNADGVAQVRIPELGRVELQIPGVESGVMLVNGEPRPLPIGVGIDREQGIVTWAPGPGYLGTYRLAFGLQDARTSGLRKVDVTVAPAASVTEPVRMHLDRVDQGRGVLTLHGWALDPAAESGAGIGAIHVWAQSRSAECGVRSAEPGCAPLFLGAADLNISRPDVATAHGAQFFDAGFRFTGALPAGEWDVVAYVWVTRTGRFEDARSVRVTIER